MPPTIPEFANIWCGSSVRRPAPATSSPKAAIKEPWSFPNAECKIFLTAGPQERARRRLEDLRARGQDIPFEIVLDQQSERDRSDATRSVGPLVRAADAVELSTDGLSPTAVVDRLEQIVRERMGRRRGA